MTDRWWLWQDDQVTPINERIHAQAVMFGGVRPTAGIVRHRVGDGILTIEGDVNDSIGGTVRRLP